jgi:hypothetical protein
MSLALSKALSQSRLAKVLPLRPRMRTHLDPYSSVTLHAYLNCRMRLPA